METIKIKSSFGDNIECREFFDIVGSSEISGIEIFKSGRRLGSLLGVSIPDKNDNDEIEKFINEIDNWLIDND